MSTEPEDIRIVRRNSSDPSTVTRVSSVTSVESKLSVPLDCVAWNTKYDILAVGGYKLIETEDSIVSNRIGRLFLIKCDSNEPEGYTTLEDFELDSGILDLKWNPGLNRLAIATSTSMKIYEFDPFREKMLTLQDQLEIEEKGMALYCEWMDFNRILFGDSRGYVSIMDARLPVRLLNSRKLHIDLTWVVHYDKDQDIIYSGCDHGTLVAFVSENFENKPKHFNRRFTVGLTSIVSNKFYVLIGSYDETIRIFTLLGKEPKLSFSLNIEIKLGGMIWRMLWLKPVVEVVNLENFDETEEAMPEDLMLAVACGRNGLQFLKINRVAWTYQIFHQCLDYKGSLAYGLDVKTYFPRNEYIIASCYFDQQLLHIWTSKLSS